MDTPWPPTDAPTALDSHGFWKGTPSHLWLHTLDDCFSPDTGSLLWGTGSLALPGVSGLLTSHHNTVRTKFIHEKFAMKYFKLLKREKKQISVLRTSVTLCWAQFIARCPHALWEQAEPHVNSFLFPGPHSLFLALLSPPLKSLSTCPSDHSLTWQAASYHTPPSALI